MPVVHAPSIASLMSMGGRPANSRREIKIVDTTLRDGHQSLWATRMRTDHIVSMAEDFDQGGFEQVDLVAPIQFDVAVRYLKEDPWERVRLAHQHAPNTKFRALVRSKNIASFDFVADDVIEAWVERLYANGFRVIGSFDGLNDVDNIAPGLIRAKQLGASTFGALSFCESPVHTDELFIRKARELIDQTDVDAIMLEDARRPLNPPRLRTRRSSPSRRWNWGPMSCTRQLRRLPTVRGNPRRSVSCVTSGHSATSSMWTTQGSTPSATGWPPSPKTKASLSAGRSSTTGCITCINCPAACCRTSVRSSRPPACRIATMNCCMR